MLQSCRVRKFARETLVIVRKSHQFRVAEGELPLYVTVISVPGRDEGTVSVGQAVKFVGTVSLRNGFSLPDHHCSGTRVMMACTRVGCRLRIGRRLALPLHVSSTRRPACA